MIRFFYIGCSTAMLALVAANLFLGYEPGNTNERTRLPADVRQSPGGYRTFIYWNSGYQGGK